MITPISNHKQIIAKQLCDLTDEEIEYLLGLSRRLTDHIPGAMNLFDIPGTKFGYAHHVEREKIKRELIRGGADPDGYKLHFDIVRQQEAIHRNDPPMREYQKFLVRQAPAVSKSFTDEELEHIVWMFENANHPLSISIAEKAIRMQSINQENNSGTN